MTDTLQTTQKGYWIVEGNNHSSQMEAFQDAGSRAVASPGTVVHVQPPSFEVVYSPAASSPPPSDPPPSDPPPSDPPPSPPPPPPPPVSPPPPPPPPAGAGTHSVKVTVDDGSKTWVMQTSVGEDWTVPATPTALKDADGNEHPGVFAMPYADGVDVGDMYGDSTTDYAGTMTVEYDGQVVFGPEAVKFNRGVPNKTIRYGRQAPWQRPDMSLFPNYAAPTGPLSFDISKFNLSYNGLGVATATSMGTTGSRPDIGYLPRWDAIMLGLLRSETATQEQLDAAFAAVRAAADVMPWPIYFIDRATGHPFDVTRYPNVSLEPRSQANFANNPIAAYAPDKGKISSATVIYDAAHATGYQFLAAAMTGTARDKWHAAVHANAAITQGNPSWHTDGLWTHTQERGTAWSLRSLFLASHVSDMPDYFAGQLELQRVKGERDVTHPLGFVATYENRTFSDGSKGDATWEENMIRLVVATIAQKDARWQTINGRLKAWLTTIFSQSYWMLAATSSLATRDPSGAQIADWASCLGHSLPNWDLPTILDPNTTAEQIGQMVYAHWQQTFPAWVGRAGDFNDKYPQDVGGHCAIQCAAVAAMCGPGPEWDKCKSVPTKPDYVGQSAWEWNIVPRTA